MSNEYNNIMANIQVSIRNLKILEEQLQRKRGTQFAPNVSEAKMIEQRTKTIKKKTAELTTML